VAVAVVALVVAAVWPRETLVLRTATPGSEDGTVLTRLPHDPAHGLELRYRHSLNGFNVHEQLQVRPGSRELVVVGQLVDGDGAGIGEVPGEGRFVAAGGGWSRLEGLERELGARLIIRVGEVADHRVVVGGREYPLRDVAGPRQRVSLGVEQVPGVVALVTQLQHRRAAPAAPREAGTRASRAVSRERVETG
jgi:hypothetical protein